MTIHRLPIGLLGSNCYLIIDPESREAAIVDPGLKDATPIDKIVREQALNVQVILNTHGHFDHTAGNHLLASTRIPLGLHPTDRQLLMNGGGAGIFGLRMKPSPEPTRDLVEGTTLTLGKLEIKVLHTPGHTPGSICLHIPQDNALLTGDTLFRGSVGRTDLPGGDAQALRASLDRILHLPDATHIYPGHGDTTTLQRERTSNPWLRSHAETR